jgi:hypothetical protein
MGGIGSGRRTSYSGKDTTEDSLPLDIRRLRRAGALNPGRAVSWQWTLNDRVYASIQIRANEWQVTLSYRHTPRGGAAESISQTVRLETTPCALGGHRQWFTCPGCSRRVAVVYGVGRLFACRRCKGLAYGCQAESADDRAARRADRLRKKLGWEPGILNGNGLKPKGMHWRTYERLLARHDNFVGVSLAGMAKKLGLLRGRLEDIEDAVR